MNNKIIFIFSGTVQATSAFMAELLAVVHFIKAFDNSSLGNEDCIIYSDSEEVLNLIIKIKAGLEEGINLVDPQGKNYLESPICSLNKLQGDSM